MDISHDVDALQVDDDVFARAYASLDAVRRSVLKKWIAHLYLFWERNRSEERSETIRWHQGVITTAVTRPLDWSLILLGETFASPTQLLAVIMPVLLSGTRRVIVAREAEGDFPVSLLVGLELAGQEDVLAADPDRLARVVEHLPERYGSQGMILGLGSPVLATRCRACLPEVDLWSAPAPQEVGIWCTSETAWDLPTIAWTLQGSVFHVGGEVPDNLPMPCTVHEESLQAFLQHDFGAFYLPNTHDPALLPAASTFGPGQEGGWLWPGITPQTCTRTTVVWHAQDTQPKEDSLGLP